MIRHLGLCVVFIVTAWGQDAIDHERSLFERRLSRVEEFAANDRWKDVHRELGRLLETHQGRAYVIDRRDEIARLMQRARFNISVQMPDPARLVSGELLAYSSKTGKIRIRYRPGSLQDFENGIHPAVFVGRHVIEVRGAAYPWHGAGPIIYACQVGAKRYVATFATPMETGGTKKYGWRRFKPAFLRYEGHVKETLDKCVSSPGRGDKRFALKVIVDRCTILAAYNDRVVMRGSKPSDRWGRVGFRNVPSLTEVIIQGRSDGAWISGLVAEQRDKQRATFLASYDPADHLPAWLLREG